MNRIFLLLFLFTAVNISTTTSVAQSAQKANTKQKSNTQTVEAAKPAATGFVIHASVTGFADGTTVEFLNGQTGATEMASEVKGGKFEFKGKLERPDFKIILFNKQPPFITLFMDNSDIHITGDKAKIDKAEITGSVIHPALSSLLILIMLAGLYFEFQAPGTIFPIAASFVAAVLYFAPLYLEGLAANWEILLFVSGVILLALEFFVIPGFGVAGIVGIICTTMGFALSMLNNKGWDFTFTSSEQITQSILISLGAMLGAVFLIFYFIGKINDSKRLSKLTLQTTQPSEHGFRAHTDIDTIQAGMRGTAFTALRPSGKIMVDGRVYDAVAETGWIERQEQVEIVSVGLTCTVRTC